MARIVVFLVMALGLMSGPLPAQEKAKYIDMVTFIKAFAEGKADTYKGFLVRGGGAAVEKNTEKGNGGKASVLVCGKRPNGTFYAITKLKDGTFNFDANKDRLFAVQLVWLETKMPKGYESGKFKFALDMPKLAERFQARFGGEYVELTIKQSGQEDRKEKCPILIWEDAEK